MTTTDHQPVDPATTTPAPTGSRTPRQPVIQVRDLRMRYGSAEVLHDVSFHARHGEVLALLGPNGAGKSTTIEILEGFRLRSAGTVEVLGVDPAHGDERWRSRLGIVLQSWRDHGNWRVRELLHHLGTYYAPYSTSATERPWDTGELLAAVGLTEHANRRSRPCPAASGGGWTSRSGSGRPELLFLDEPTTGFDPQARHEFHDLVRRLAAEQRRRSCSPPTTSTRPSNWRTVIPHPDRRPDRRGRRHHRRNWPGGAAAQAEVRWTGSRRHGPPRTHRQTRPAWSGNSTSETRRTDRRPGGPPPDAGGHLSAHGAPGPRGRRRRRDPGTQEAGAPDGENEPHEGDRSDRRDGSDGHGRGGDTGRDVPDGHHRMPAPGHGPPPARPREDRTALPPPLLARRRPARRNRAASPPAQPQGDERPC